MENQKEIKAGDAVRLILLHNEHVDMIVGCIKDDVASCFWANNGDVKRLDIPVIALTHVDW